MGSRHLLVQDTIRKDDTINTNLMPVKVRKGTGARPWKIVEKSTGKIVATSTSKKKADASARYRNEALSNKKK